MGLPEVSSRMPDPFLLLPQVPTHHLELTLFRGTGRVPWTLSAWPKGHSLAQFFISEKMAQLGAMFVLDRAQITVLNG